MLRLKNGELLPLVNESSVKTEPQGAIDQLRHSLMQMIQIFSQADKYMKFFMENGILWITWDHVAVFSDNQTTVSWVNRLASKVL